MLWIGWIIMGVVGREVLTPVPGPGMRHAVQRASPQGSLQIRFLEDTGSPSLQVTPGQWYRYHSITTNIYYYPNIPLWIAQRVQVSLGPGESTPIYVDSLELFFVANNQNPNFTDTAYIWADSAGQPGAVLHRIPFQVPTDPALAGWRLLLYFEDPLVVNNTVFWIGYRSLAQATDTVFVASEACNNCANPNTSNRYSFNGTTWNGPFTRDWGVAVYARKAHTTDEGVWSLVFPNWPFVVGQLDGDTVQVVHRNWGGGTLTTMGGKLVVNFNGTSDTFPTPLNAGPYPSTAQDTYAVSMAPYVGQGVSDVIIFTAWSQQPGDQDLSNDTLSFSDYIFPNYTQWAQGWEFSTTGWAAYDADGNGSTWAIYVGGGMHTGYRAVGDTARVGENNTLVGPAWTLGGTPGDASFGNLLSGFVNVPAGVSVTLTVMALDGSDPNTATVLWQKDHNLRGLFKAGWIEIQDTLDPTLNGSTVYPAWRLASASATPSLILLDNLYGRAGPVALAVAEERHAGNGRLVWKGPRFVEIHVGEGPVWMALYETTGRRVGRWVLHRGITRLDWRRFPKGIYTVRLLFQEGNAQTLRVVLP